MEELIEGVFSHLLLSDDVEDVTPLLVIAYSS